MNKKLFLMASFCCFAFASFPAYGTEVPTQVMTTTTTRTTENVSLSQVIANSFVTDATLAPFAGNVVVRVDNGVVTLSGSAPSEKVKFDFENKAKSATGVAKIVNHIEVKQGVNHR